LSLVFSSPLFINSPFLVSSSKSLQQFPHHTMEIPAEYSNKTLIGNWWEDRLTPAIAPDPRNGVVNKAKVRDTAPRVLPKDPVLDPMVSVSSSTYVHHHRPSGKKEAPRLLQLEAVETAKSSQEIQSKIQARTQLANIIGHDSNQSSEFYSVSHSAYGGKYSEHEEHRQKTDHFHKTIGSHVIAGLSNKAREERQDKCGLQSSGAVGERPIVGDDVDPGSHTNIQRSWIGNPDFFRYSRPC